MAVKMRRDLWGFRHGTNLARKHVLAVSAEWTSPAAWPRRQRPSARVLRLVELGRREGEDFGAVLGNADGVLELRGKRAVAGYGGPSIGQHFHVRTTEIDHRLNREEHSRLEDDAFPRTRHPHHTVRLA